MAKRRKNAANDISDESLSNLQATLSGLSSRIRDVLKGSSYAGEVDNYLNLLAQALTDRSLSLFRKYVVLIAKKMAASAEGTPELESSAISVFEDLKSLFLSFVKASGREMYSQEEQTKKYKERDQALLGNSPRIGQLLARAASIVDRMSYLGKALKGYW